MACSRSEKTGFGLCLIFTILLVALHLALVTQGYKFAQDYDDDANNDRSRLYFKEQKQEIIFIVIAAGLTFFISLALLAGICTDCISPRVKHVLATFNLLLELSIAVVVALRASNNYNWRDAESGLEDKYSSFKYYYRLSIFDAVITFALEVVYLVVIFFGTLREVVHLEVMQPVVADVPPLSNRQF